ncbi:MAG: M36 family metallopeptidase [Proteobacteria bacterium]|nr:M36 family metallopeptidase [Pseudomonadota bacterium]
MNINITIKFLIVSCIILFNFSIYANTQENILVKNTKAQNYLKNNHQSLGLSLKDVNDAQIKTSFQSSHNGLTHIYFKQSYNGIELHDSSLQIHLNSKDEVVVLHNQFIAKFADKVNMDKPKITALKAIEIALGNQNLSAKSPITLISKTNNFNQAAIYSNAGVTLADIPVKLVYKLDKHNIPKLAWNLELQFGSAWLSIRVDAADGNILDVYNFTVSDSYDVFPQPYMSPRAAGASFQTVTDVADVNASPFGWHDTDGKTGAEFTDTRGNNVSAQEDVDDNNSGGFRPDGGASLDFNFIFDESLQPDEGENLEVGIVNLFYWNNIIHDIMYQYGFDEVAGNFQENNYGNAGLSGDSVNADALDGSGNNNANFATPPDGFNPRMQMFRYLASPDFFVITPASIAAQYIIGGASFGVRIDTTGILEEVNDNTDTNSDGCSALVGFTAGNIALIDRGECEFGVKVKNAEDAGAIAALVINNQGNSVMNMGPGAVGDTVAIPSVFIGQDNGNLIRAELTNTVNVNIVTTNKDRDGDLDNGIIIHEYGHGISNRLVGGGSNTFCLDNEEQAGEGWSDFFSLVLTAQAGEQATDAKPMGVYATNNEFGIRQYPYTTDMTLNPHTFANLGDVSVPHGVGSVWAAMLWEVYWNLIDTHGYDADIYYGEGGNNIMLQLVLDGMKLSPCSPSFVQGRDAILAADNANNAGANQCAIWRGFAKRGLGLSASSGNNDTVGDEIEAFDVSNECMNEDLIFANDFE